VYILHQQFDGFPKKVTCDLIWVRTMQQLKGLVSKSHALGRRKDVLSLLVMAEGIYIGQGKPLSKKPCNPLRSKSRGKHA